MKNILILGANGGLAQTVIPVLLENPELILTLVSRNIRRLQTFANERVNVVQADVMDLPQLESLMQGQDVVYTNLAGNLEAMAENIVQAMNRTNVKRLIWISSMGIYGETGEDHGAILEPYRRSAQVVENSRLDYTIIRPAWFTDGHEIDYQLTRKGEPFQGRQVSKRSIAHLIAKLIERPEFSIRESLGIGRI
ncbi:NAD(P)H-binding protein [Neisseria mucosa]|uniref:NAD(P)H-binding protein n=1 Tax=Neisseria mucosa TaxID=488 RepID=A0AAW6ZGE0_NEIMU|nr:NAD(P)H-binding protein [Neisseria mucosa]ARC51389.1 NAD-dependent dehydratase [Neisseria mucosa]AVR78602.1 NAD-dependent dehydratase [Neisseria mucosa]MDK6727309.1 NAD(P)H-binding protein [Neisseria mucosa]MDK6871656.1 NAD(P)H-binding protein [Neisseria mucosa]MDK8111289.1 NAD(P)H-binding protein [Neisseria mucosa]